MDKKTMTTQTATAQTAAAAVAAAINSNGDQFAVAFDIDALLGSAPAMKAATTPAEAPKAAQKQAAKAPKQKRYVLLLSELAEYLKVRGFAVAGKGRAAIAERLSQPDCALLVDELERLKRFIGNPVQTAPERPANQAERDLVELFQGVHAAIRALSLKLGKVSNAERLPRTISMVDSKLSLSKWPKVSAHGVQLNAETGDVAGSVGEFSNEISAHRLSAERLTIDFLPQTGRKGAWAASEEDEAEGERLNRQKGAGIMPETLLMLASRARALGAAAPEGSTASDLLAAAQAMALTHGPDLVGSDGQAGDRQRGNVLRILGLAAQIRRTALNAQTSHTTYYKVVIGGNDFGSVAALPAENREDERIQPIGAQLKTMSSRRALEACAQAWPGGVGTPVFQVGDLRVNLAVPGQLKRDIVAALGEDATPEQVWARAWQQLLPALWLQRTGAVFGGGSTQLTACEAAGKAGQLGINVPAHVLLQAERKLKRLSNQGQQSLCLEVLQRMDDELEVLAVGPDSLSWIQRLLGQKLQEASEAQRKLDAQAERLKQLEARQDHSEEEMAEMLELRSLLLQSPKAAQANAEERAHAEMFNQVALRVLGDIKAQAAPSANTVRAPQARQRDAQEDQYDLLKSRLGSGRARRR